MDSLAAERERQDMRIIGHLEANRRTVETSATTTSTNKTPRKRKHARTTYSIGGIEVSQNTFHFLMGSRFYQQLATPQSFGVHKELRRGSRQHAAWSTSWPQGLACETTANTCLKGLSVASLYEVC
ncbi:hypothetical protein GOODEAATRI_002772 [Goodea atripinnis]|uniref:Uncharacterized protein n=1 Tax=Goodea atripinnis TaxID=208336 RepID=A0ABV0MEM1_9TELE